ncbi:MAG: preprotein translocase subunit SecY [Eubacteriales bacterium]
MFETIRNAWKIKDLRNKILFTLGMLLVYRIAAAVRLPNINFDATAAMSQGNNLFAMMDLFNGGTLKYFTLLATGITPYITASIIMQLLTMAIPALERLQKEGEEGRKKITKITRYLGIGLALFQSLAIMITNRGILYNNAWYMVALIGIIQAAGTAFAMWLGESISEKGIGNGISLLIFINIISRLPVDMVTGVKSIIEGVMSPWIIPAVIIGVLIVIVSVVFVNIGERRIPIVYSKRISGRKMYGGQSTYIPMRVNSSGVLPLIFAMTFVNLPSMILPYFPEWGFTIFYNKHLGIGSIPYAVVMILLIIAFAYFYSTITFNPFEMAENLRKYGGKVRGIREGKPTAVYMQKISSRITLFAALFLAFLAVIPMAILATTGSSSPLQATSILIMVSVAIETSKQIEAQLISHNHRGFL